MLKVDTLSIVTLELDLRTKIPSIFATYWKESAANGRLKKALIESNLGTSYS